jgi:hypothetical protein
MDVSAWEKDAATGNKKNVRLNKRQAIEIRRYR